MFIGIPSPSRLLVVLACNGHHRRGNTKRNKPLNNSKKMSSGLSSSLASSFVFVTGLPSTVTEAEFRSLLCSCGQVTHIQINCIKGKPCDTALLRWRGFDVR